MSGPFLSVSYDVWPWQAELLFWRMAKHCVWGLIHYSTERGDGGNWCSIWPSRVTFVWASWQTAFEYFAGLIVIGLRSLLYVCTKVFILLTIDLWTTDLNKALCTPPQYFNNALRLLYAVQVYEQWPRTLFNRRQSIHCKSNISKPASEQWWA